jgi:hypothetical protein
MRAILAGFALTTFFVTPTLADYYIVQEPTTKRCRIVEERPAPGVGVVIGGIGFGVRTEAESRMRTECRETSGSDVIIEERERRPARWRTAIALDTAGLAPEWRHEVRFG